jgi:hypothetical protein
MPNDGVSPFRFLRHGPVPLSLIVLFFALPVHASETAVENQNSMQSSFHLISFKCEHDADEGAQTTPQSPPLDVDDPGTPGCNAWEINMVVDGNLTSNQNTWELPLLDLNYGIGDTIQLKYEVPFLNQQADGASISAMGESILGIKYMFFNDEQSKTQLAVYPQRTFVGGNADAVTRGLVTPGAITTIPVLMSREIAQTSRGPVSITANLGYNLSTKTDTTDFISAALGIGAPVFRRVGLMAELATQQAIVTDSTGTRQQLLKADIGTMGTLTRNFILFGAIGRSLTASDLSDHSYVVAGFQVLAGGM